MANSTIRSVVHGLLAASACISAGGALAASPVANEVHSWNIPAEDGPAAVRDFGVQSGVAISATQTDLQGKRLNAVSGSMSVDSALRRLVAGTGLKYTYDASGKAVTLTVAGAAAAARTPAPSETPRAPAKAAGDPRASAAVLVEEIVVTSRKREENLQDVAISAQVISGQQLQDYNIRSMAELAQSVPGIQLNGTAASGQFFIRGIGSGTSFGDDQSVVTFIDDVSHARTRISEQAFLDLDRVEILKGPQSTYFGNNAVAGALNIVTAKPTDTYEGSVRALYGEYGQYGGEGMLNIPLSSDLSVRVAAIGDGMSGWASNAVGNKEPDQNNRAARVTFLYRPSDDFDATLKTEGGINEESDGSVVGDCPPPAPFSATLNATSQRFCNAAQTNHIKTGVNLFQDTTGNGQGLRLSTFEDVLTMHYHMGENTLTSVSAFYDDHFTETLDADGLPLQLFTQRTTESFRQVSQELRIASPLGNTFEWMGGLYMQDSRLAGSSGNLTYYYLTTPTLAAALKPYTPLATAGFFEEYEHQYSAFGAVDWNVTEELKAGVGLRTTWDYKSAQTPPGFNGTASPGGGITPLPPSAITAGNTALGLRPPAWYAENSYNAAMPSAHINYKIVPAVMLYATYSRGWLAGQPANVGYVNPNVADVPPTPAIRPEHVNDFELGWKSTLFGDHVRLNMDVFRSNYTNEQVTNSVTGVNPTTGAPALFANITNAGASRAQGVEFSGEWVQDGFRLKADLTYLDSRYTSYQGVTLTAAQSFCRNSTSAACLAYFGKEWTALTQDLTGAPTSFAPTWSGTVTTSYSFALPRGYHFITEGDFVGSSWYYFGNNGTDDPEQAQNGYVRVDGRFTFESPDTHWAVDVIMKNLTDKVIFLGGAGGTSLPLTAGSTLLQIDQPRNFAIQGRYQW